MSYQALQDYYGQSLKEKSKNDRIFFINNLKTFDPRTKDKDLKFELYPFQIDYAKVLFEHIDQGKNLFVEKSRDMGVSWVTSAVILWYWLFEDGFQALVGSRKEDYVDNKMIDSLFGKFDYLINSLPWKIDKWDPNKHRLFMKLMNPENGANITGESANANFSRGGRYKVVFFDEMAFWPYQEPSWTAASDAAPCKIAVTTPSPEPTYAKQIRNNAQGMIDVHSLHWHLHPLKTQEWYEKEKKTRGAEELARELDINWEGALTGTVYPEIKNVTLDKFDLLDSQIYCSWDFGLDGVAILWWQKNPKNMKWRLLQSYFNQDKPIDFYFPFFGKPVNSEYSYTAKDFDLMEQVKDLPKAIHYGDPDVEKRSILTGTSTKEALAEAQIYVQTNRKANDFESRKSETKKFLLKEPEINDTPTNRYFLDMVRSAHYPQRREASQSVTPTRLPVHDNSSHPRTALEYFCVNIADLKDDEPEFVTFGQGDSITRYGSTGRGYQAKGNQDFMGYGRKK